jgi:hypothetical protein
MRVDSQWALFIATLVLVCITAWYARETSRMAAHMKQQTDAMMAPRIVVRLERSRGNVSLVAENRGLTPVRDLRLATDKQVPTCDSGVFLPLPDHRAFKRPIYLGPSDEYRIVLGSEQFIKENRNYYLPRFTVSATYTLPDGAQSGQSVPIEILSMWTKGEVPMLE